MRPRKLECVVVADPVVETAAGIAACCGRIANRVLTTTVGQQAVFLSVTQGAELAIVARELKSPDCGQVVHRIRSTHPATRVILTFREMMLAELDEWRKLDVDLAPQPVDTAALSRIVWRRFGISSRQHPRYPVVLDVTRADGVLLGRTRNLSHGGALVDLTVPMRTGDSVMVDLMLPARPLRVRVHMLAVEGEAPNPMRGRLQFDGRGPEQRRLAEYLAVLDQREVADATR